MDMSWKKKRERERERERERRLLFYKDTYESINKSYKIK